MSYNEDLQSEALRYADEVVSISTACNVPWGIGTGQAFQGISAANAGDLTAARMYWHQSLRQYRANRDLRGTSTSCVSLGSLALIERDYQFAGDLLAEALAAATMLDDKVGLLYVLSCLGALAALEGKAADARRQLRAALVIAKMINSPWLILDALSGAAQLHALEGRAVAAYELAVMARQMPVMLSASRPLLDQLCAELDNQLTPAEIAAATNRGLSRSITETADELLALWQASERAIEGHTRPPKPPSERQPHNSCE